MVLLLGCGNSRDLRLVPSGTEKDERKVYTVDIDPACKPDYVHDLNVPLASEESYWDEIHAYEVLEHLGRQGDWRGFFAEFNNYWHMLKPGGHFMASVPRHDGKWAWSDPGHTRIISGGTLSFLSQAVYERDVGKTTMTDYRNVYRGDFELVHLQHEGDSMYFGLKAIKKGKP